MNDQERESKKSGLAESISGLGQKIIGELETFGGILTGDPITQADGEYNVEVGDMRQDLEDELEENEEKKTE